MPADQKDPKNLKTFAKTHLNKEDFWEHIQWTDETKM